MARPARASSFRSALVAVFTLFAGLHLSGRQTPVPDRQQPSPPPATGLIVGQVLDAAAGKPVPGAIVSLTTGPAALAATGLANLAEGIEVLPAGPAVPNRVIADAEGRFVFRNLPKGRYGFSAIATGYLSGPYGQRRPGGPGLTLELEEGDKLLDAVFRLWKAATITGTVTDEAGEPVVGVSVRSLRRTIAGGRTRWTPSLSATTDDRGIYRLANLTPGDYSVAVMSATTTLPAATVDAYRETIMAGQANTTSLMLELQTSGAPFPSMSGIRVGDQILQQGSTLTRGAAAPAPSEDGNMLGYQTTYHPAATSASQLTVITLSSGEDRTGIDLHLRLVPTVRVSGTVTGPEGPVPNMGVRLLPANFDDFSTDLGLEAAVTATDARGAFTFLGVPAGAYTLKILKTPRPASPIVPSEGMVMVSSGAGGISFGTSMGPAAPPIPPPLPTEPTLWGSVPVNVGEADDHGRSRHPTNGLPRDRSGRIRGDSQPSRSRAAPADVGHAAAARRANGRHRDAWTRHRGPAVPDARLSAGPLSRRRRWCGCRLDAESRDARRTRSLRRAARDRAARMSAASCSCSRIVPPSCPEPSGMRRARATPTPTSWSSPRTISSGKRSSVPGALEACERPKPARIRFRACRQASTTSPPSHRPRAASGRTRSFSKPWRRWPRA